MEIPNHITHYYSALDKPFQNLSELSDEQLGPILDTLNKRRRNDPGYKRVFGSRYMALRKATEEKLVAMFVEIGGKPERRVPHYFVLGECDWFAGLYPDTKTVQLDWRSVKREHISFTYPDSFVAMQLGADFGLHLGPAEPYHGRVFFMDDLRRTVARHGFPNGSADDDYSGYAARPFEKFIEVQIWSDTPIAEFLKPAA